VGASAILKLERAGFTHEQVDALAEYLDGQAATRADVNAVKDELTARINESRLESKSEIAEFRAEARAEIGELSAETKSEISGFRAETRSEFAAIRFETKAEFAAVRSEIMLLEQRMTIKLGAMLAIAIGVVGTMVKIL
jgi:hypothetical protein